MTTTPAALQSGVQLTTTTTAIYTTPASTIAIVKAAVLNNITGGSVNVTIYRVPAAGAAGSTNQLAVVAVAANAAVVVAALANMVLGPGESIQASAASATAINAFLSGFLVT